MKPPNPNVTPSSDDPRASQLEPARPPATTRPPRPPSPPVSDSLAARPITRPPPPPDEDDLDIYAPLPEVDSALEPIAPVKSIPVVPVVQAKSVPAVPVAPTRSVPVVPASPRAQLPIPAQPLSARPRLLDRVADDPGAQLSNASARGTDGPNLANASASRDAGIAGTAGPTYLAANRDAPPTADDMVGQPDLAGNYAGEASPEILVEMPMPEPRAAPTVAGIDARKKLPLGQLLLASGAIQEDQLELALAEQRRTRSLLGETLISLGFSSEQTIAETVSAQTGIPFVRVQAEPIAPELLKMVPEDVCRKHRLVPLGTEGSVLRLAMANPFDVVAVDYVRTTTGLIPFPSIAPWGEIVKAIERHFARQDSFSDAFEDLISAAEARADDLDAEEVAGGPLVDLVDQLIIRAAEERATDIHIEPEEQVIRVRYRVDSILQPGPTVPKKLQSAVSARIKVMAGLNVAESRVPQDGRIRFSIKGRNVDLRVSTFLCNFGENIVLRLLDKSSVVLSLEKLGLLPDDLAKMERFLNKPHGIILVTGPTGSGKTTTLYASLAKLNTIDVNIMTIEDPIEYEMNLIRQSQVNVKAGITFATGLRALLRQDPDIILIGEMRDTETATMAVRAAMTGHMVFSTLHTNTAVGAVNRLVDMGVDPLLVSDTVIAAIGQRLGRLACPKCKELVPCPDVRKAELEEAAVREKIEWDGMVAEARGCVECKMRGYKGRGALYEFFEMTHAAKALILARKFGQDLADLAHNEGMRSMYDDGLRRVLLHIMTISELDRVIDKELRAEIEGH
jgi:type II secretory ATPase GspE/PulE/Tfp pilus assembly ATPase PilB-like protein